MAAPRVLALAVAKGRAGYVYMAGGELKDWGCSVKAVRSANETVSWAQNLISQLKPDVVVTEEVDAGCRKGRRSRRLIKALAELASHNYVLDVSVPRPRRHSCKYAEANVLADKRPALRGWVPPTRRYWGSEPRNTILFEALALAEEVIFGPLERLAAALG